MVSNAMDGHSNVSLVIILNYAIVGHISISISYKTNGRIHVQSFSKHEISSICKTIIDA